MGPRRRRWATGGAPHRPPRAASAPLDGTHLKCGRLRGAQEAGDGGGAADGREWRRFAALPDPLGRRCGGPRGPRGRARPHSRFPLSPSSSRPRRRLKGRQQGDTSPRSRLQRLPHQHAPRAAAPKRCQPSQQPGWGRRRGRVAAGGIQLNPSSLFIRRQPQLPRARGHRFRFRRGQQRGPDARPAAGGVDGQGEEEGGAGRGCRGGGAAAATAAGDVAMATTPARRDCFEGGRRAGSGGRRVGVRSARQPSPAPSPLLPHPPSGTRSATSSSGESPPPPPAAAAPATKLAALASAAFPMKLRASRTEAALASPGAMRRTVRRPSRDGVAAAVAGRPQRRLVGAWGILSRRKTRARPHWGAAAAMPTTAVCAGQRGRRPPSPSTPSAPFPPPSHHADVPRYRCVPASRPRAPASARPPPASRAALRTVLRAARRPPRPLLPSPGATRNAARTGYALVLEEGWRRPGRPNAGRRPRPSRRRLGAGGGAAAAAAPARPHA